VTDARLRELERRARESGSVEDSAVWLRERLRAGDVNREQLVLAAYLGHAGARAFLEDEARAAPAPPAVPPERPVYPDATQRFRFGEWRHDPAGKAKEADRADLMSWTNGISELAPDDYVEGRAAIAAARSATFGGEAAELAKRILPLLDSVLLYFESDGSWGSDADEAERRLTALHAEALGAGGRLAFLAHLIEAVPGSEPFPYPGIPPGGALREVVDHIGRTLGQGPVARAAIERELVPWLLETGDPIRDRGKMSATASPR
jgi:hypothetical protein